MHRPFNPPSQPVVSNHIPASSLGFNQLIYLHPCVPDDDPKGETKSVYFVKWEEMIRKIKKQIIKVKMAPYCNHENLICVRRF